MCDGGPAPVLLWWHLAARVQRQKGWLLRVGPSSCPLVPADSIFACRRLRNCMPSGLNTRDAPNTYCCSSALLLQVCCWAPGCAESRVWPPVPLRCWQPSLGAAL